MDPTPGADGFARLPQPPYWAVIFSAQRRGGEHPADEPGYAAAARAMEVLAAGQPGFLGLESTRDATGFGITVSYWASAEALAQWRRHAEHALVRATGRDHWYERYELRVAVVERAYGWELDAPGTDPGADSG